MRGTSGAYGLKPTSNSIDQVEIVFDEGVFAHILREIRRHPNVEEGGKYLGYLLAPGRPFARGFETRTTGRTVLITKFLPSGPNATRTAVEFLPDGEYQERVFRQLEKQDPEIEHVGTWHTHHCNGLKTLSGGDVEGYFRTVNKPAYRPDFFVASLVTRIPAAPEERGWIEHFLFVRGSTEFHDITGEVRTVKLRDMEVTDAKERVRGRTECQSAASHEQALKCDNPPWYQTQVGRRTLSEDRRFFGHQFGENVVSKRRGNQINTTGYMEGASMSVEYPERAEDSTIRVSVLREGLLILQMSCEVPNKHVAFAAAVAAMQSL
jgi:hypothetical protein